MLDGQKLGVFKPLTRISTRIKYFGLGKVDICEPTTLNSDCSAFRCQCTLMGCALAKLNKHFFGHVQLLFSHGAPLDIGVLFPAGFLYMRRTPTGKC
jgi:hypothetical protein